MTREVATLRGYRIGVTAARKADEQTTLLERRGAEVEWAPALSVEPNRVDEPALRAATESVLDAPVDMLIATTGIGMRSWFAAAESWGLLAPLQEALARAEPAKALDRVAPNGVGRFLSVDVDAFAHDDPRGRIVREPGQGVEGPLPPAGGLVGRVHVERAAEHLGLTGDDPHVLPAEARQSGHEVLCPLRLDLEEVAIVDDHIDHAPHVVRPSIRSSTSGIPSASRST